jgi:hypothetical protein
MARIAVFQSHQDPTTDIPQFCSKSIAAILKRTGQAVEVGPRAIQMLEPSGSPAVLVTAEMQRAAGYDQAVNRPPVGYHESSPTKLMFGQMWEKRASAGFEILPEPRTASRPRQEGRRFGTPAHRTAPDQAESRLPQNLAARRGLGRTNSQEYLSVQRQRMGGVLGCRAVWRCGGVHLAIA